MLVPHGNRAISLLVCGPVPTVFVVTLLSRSAAVMEAQWEAALAVHSLSSGTPHALFISLSGRQKGNVSKVQGPKLEPWPRPWKSEWHQIHYFPLEKDWNNNLMSESNISLNTTFPFPLSFSKLGCFAAAAPGGTRDTGPGSDFLPLHTGEQKLQAWSNKCLQQGTLKASKALNLSFSLQKFHVLAVTLPHLLPPWSNTPMPSQKVRVLAKLHFPQLEMQTSQEMKGGDVWLYQQFH